MTSKRASEMLSENLTAIYGYAFSKLYDKEKVDDLASEIVYEIISSACNLQKEDAFWGYAWKIAENTFRRFIRKNELTSRNVELSDRNIGVYSLSPEQEYIENEIKSDEIYLLRRELSLLKKTHREVCVAFYVDNKSCSQIAQERNISVEMVKYYLFKTRKILKEGIDMKRELGEMSYNPGIFRLGFWGDYNKYADLFNRKLPGAIILATYAKPMTANELSVELGVAMPYLEEEIESLEAAGVIKNIREKYYANLIIFTDEYETAFVKSTCGIYSSLADSVWGKVNALLPEIRRLDFKGNDYDDNRLIFAILNIAFVKGYHRAGEKSPNSKPPKLPIGGHGWVFGYDNDYKNHHFHGVCMETWNKGRTAWFSAENYNVIKKAQLYEHKRFFDKIEIMCDAILGNPADRENDMLPELIENGFIMCRDNVLSANFPVFEETVFKKLILMLDNIIDEVSCCMIDISHRATAELKKIVPEYLKNQCEDVAKIHHRLDVAAFLFEELIGNNRLVVPDEKIPLCVWGVKV